MERARIVLRCFDGKPVTAVAASLKVRTNTVIDWRRRSATEGVADSRSAGPESDAEGGNLCRLPSHQIRACFAVDQRITNILLQIQPTGYESVGHWSTFIEFRLLFTAHHNVIHMRCAVVPVVRTVFADS